jgi:hypothetical protein
VFFVFSHTLLSTNIGPMALNATVKKFEIVLALFRRSSKVNGSLGESPDTKPRRIPVGRDAFPASARNGDQEEVKHILIN